MSLKESQYARGLVASFLLILSAIPVFAGPEIDTASSEIVRNAVNQSGSTISFTSANLNADLGELSGSTISYTSYRLFSGLMQINSFPGPASNFSAIALSSVATQIHWNAPGVDEALGSLQTGSRYYVQYSSVIPAWNYENSQIAISTSGVNPGDAQGYPVSELLANTTYFYGIWTADPAGNVSDLSSGAVVATLSQPVNPLTSTFLMVGASSATAGWAALSQNPSSATSEGYELDASTASDFSGTLLSSITANVLDSTLTVSNLNPDATYYFRVGSLNWNQSQDFVSIGSTITSAASPALTTPAFTMVGVTSTTVQWSSNGNPAGAQYLLNLSTTSNFTGTLFSSNTLNLSATLTGLNPNATYYAEVQAMGINDISSAFALLGSTVTQASEPQSVVLTFSPVYVSSLTVSFQNGTPANPAGTLYDVWLSTDPAFSVYLTSVTANFSAGFTGLLPDTSYYSEVASENDLGVLSPDQSLGSTSTLAVPPASVASSYSNLSGSGFTLSWSSGALATGFNPGNALYEAQAALDSGFTTGIVDEIVSTTSVGFGGLTSNTVYYTRVRALNWQELPTSYVTYGSTQTLQSSIPSLLAGTFLVSNATGGFQSPLLYTDTTTPSLQVQVQSSFAPGLSVTDTPNTWAIWHLDENTGTTGYDSSLHGNNLNLTGTVSWAPGIIGSAVSCDGGTTEGYGVNLVNNPTTFTIGVWLKTTTTSGGMILGFGNAQTGASGNYDRHIWMDNSGHIYFGVYTGQLETIGTGKTYNDGNWHFAMANISSAGEFFYVDGAQVGSLTNTGSQAYNGYWRLCYDNLNGWSPSPASYYFLGSVDEVFIDTSDALSASQVSEYYNLVKNETHELGEPSVDISTTAGNADTWVRMSTANFAITGANGTTQTQLWSSTLSISGLSLIQSTAPNAPTNQVFFLASDITSEIASSQYTILVDTTPPLVPNFSSLINPTTFGLTVNGISGYDALSGLAAQPFDIEASTDPTFGIVDTDSGFISGSSFTFNSLNANTTYYIRARAKDAASNISAFSTPQSLATLTDPISSSQILSVSSAAATLSWTGLPISPSSTTSEGYELDASTASDFSGTVFSSSTNSNAQTTLLISGLNSDTTYYFRVGSLNWEDIPNYVSAQSTSTLASAPSALTLLSISTNDAALSWTAGPGSEQGYKLDASSTDFSGTGTIFSSATANGALTTLSVSGLLSNTTYFFRVGSLNWDNAENDAAIISSATWSQSAQINSPIFLNVFVSSAQVQWAALPVTPKASSAEGYELLASTASDFSGFIFSTETISVIDSTLTITGLASLTTYYFEVGTLNWNQIPNFIFLGSTETESSSQNIPPAAVTNLTASTDTVMSLNLQWTAPSDPYSNPWDGNYAIQYSTWSGVVWSTSNAQVLFTTSSVLSGTAQYYELLGLNSNTTYYIHLWASDTVPNWSNLSNGATQAVLADSISGLEISPSSSAFTASWTPLPLIPSSSTSEGYLFNVSTMSNFTGLVFSSQTASASAGNLGVLGLNANTTYYFEAGSLNWDDAPNYNYLIDSTATMAQSIQSLSSNFLMVRVSSATAGWTALAQNPSSSTSEGYELDASTASDFSGVILSSITTSVLDSTLTVLGLNPDATYYFRVGSLNWNQLQDFASIGSTITSASSPALISPAFTMVGITSTTIQWGANGNPAGAQYFLNLSTASNFTGTLFSSNTLSLSATLTGLNPNATYYAEVQATGINGVPSAFSSLGSTVTQASEPASISNPFSPVYISSLTVSFQNGTPANPAGTLYDVWLSTDPAFSVYLTSVTAEFSAGFTGLSINTSYYAEAAGENWQNVLSSFTSLGSTSTLAVIPGGPGIFNGVGGNSFTVSWTSGTPGGGYNPSWTEYDLQVSTSSNFTGAVVNDFVNALSGSVGGLLPGSVYYAQVAGVNQDGILSPFATLGSTTTANSAIPSFINGTFLVSNAAGGFQSPALYTDTTTPNLQIQILSNSVPGLSVTDTPDTWAIWHLDEDAGTTGYDASLHGNNLDLAGTIAWQLGILGSSVYFDGSTTYGYSANSVTNPTTFTIAAWFKTANGYNAGGKIIGFGNAQTGASSSYDRHIYMTNSGTLEFGVWTGATQMVASGSPYNDGNWHFVMATLSGAGMYLYVDGNQVGYNSNTAAQAYTGYWRLGYDSLGGWPNAPTSDYFKGNIDEVFINNTDALSASQAAVYYNLVKNETHELGAPNVDVSTQAGNNFTWIRFSTAAFAISGANGTTTQQLWSSSFTLSGLNLTQSTAPNAGTDQVMFLGDSADSQMTTAQFTILVDTTPPIIPTFSLTSTTSAVAANNLLSSDNPSGLAAFDVQISTYSNFSSINQDSGFSAASQTSWTFNSLNANTTYYIQARAQDNATNVSAFSTIDALSTLAQPPSGFTATITSENSTTLTWTALPASPQTSTSEGYEVEASSMSDFSGTIYSSSTPNVLNNVLTLSGLSPDTTYYFRVGSLDWSDIANFAPSAISTATLAQIPVNLALNSISTNTANLSWTQGVGNNQGYLLEASSTNFNGTGSIISSATLDSSNTSLTLAPLIANTTYYFRISATNWNGLNDFSSVLSSSTWAQPISATVTQVLSNSISASWTPLPASPSSATSEGYELDASSTNFGALSSGGAIYFSSTTSSSVGTLTVNGLDFSTVYYLRAGSLNWDGVADYTAMPSTSALAAEPLFISPAFTMVGVSSASVEWGANGNPDTTQYNLNLSTVSNFTGTLFSSSTLNTFATLTGLNPNATYYAEVQSVSGDGALTPFVALGSTMTLASEPQVPSDIFDPVFVTSLTVSFLNGSPTNPSNTFYDVQLSTDPAFSVYSDSLTENLSASFTGLSINTTYYAQVATENGLDELSPYQNLGSTSTLAVPPGTNTPTFSGVSAQSFTLSWSSGSATSDYNPNGTLYLAQISTAANFSNPIQSIVSSLQTSFSGLVSGTLYYAEVAALNNQNIASAFTNYGSVTTLNSAAPTYLVNSFELSDSLGVYISPTQYTDTTTPNLQVQVQSNYTPGLSVTDTPSQLALWHLDEDAGSTSFDSSLHGNALTLNGGYTWLAGKLGSAIQFDGSTGYGLSPNFASTGWRSSAANNQWSISLWFNTGLAHGYLFQVANSASAGAGTYDGELSWYRSTGKLTFEITSSAGTRYYASASSSYNNNLWHFATGVLNTSGFYLYVDGNLAASNTSVNSTNARTYTAAYLWLGAASTLAANTGGSTAVRFYPGTMDEILLSTVALTSPQIAQLYNLVSGQTHEMGAPNVDLSTQAGANYSWTRLSTATFNITGADGTTAAQTWTSTVSLSNFSFIQSTAPAAPTNQVMFLEDSLDSQLTTAQYTILVDTTPPSVPTFSALANPTTFGLTVPNLSASDSLSGLNAEPFDVQASTDSGFGIINADSGWIAGPNFTFTTLLPNTTYFIRAEARNAAGSQGIKSAWSSSQDLATLSLQPYATSFIQVYFSSVTVGWAALRVSPSSASSEGYEVDASTAPDFSGLITSSITANVLDSTLTVTGLDLNTTYYFRVASLNWGDVENDAVIGDSVTWAQTPLLNSPNFLIISTSAITTEWAGLPLTPPSQTAEEFLLETSSTDFGTGTVYSSATTDVQDSTLTISGLLPNTTYFFKVASYNWDNAYSYLVLGATSSLANLVVSPSTAAVYVSSASISWSLVSGYAEGYELDASTASDFTGTIVSTITPNALATGLTLLGLQSSTSYYFRVGAFNWNDVLNYAAAGSTVTHVSVDASTPTAITTLTASTLTATTAELNWATPTPVDPNPIDQPLSGNYAIEYSTWTGVVWSTSGAQVVFSTSGVSSGQEEGYAIGGLNSNTTYYFRIWTANSRPNWSTLSNGATVDMLAQAVSNASYVSIATGVVGVGWTALPASPQSDASEGYELDASSVSNFTGIVFSSVTADVTMSSLAISGLNPNTTYFFRVGSLNWNLAPDYIDLTSTSTLANPVPILSPSFFGVFPGSATIRWAALPLTPSSSTAEGYEIDASTAPDFSGSIYSSATTNVLDSTLTVSGLAVDTTYYFRAESLNWNNSPSYAALPDTSTLAEPPTLISPAYTLVANADIVAQWSPNGNPSNAIYELDFSTASNFTGTLYSSVTLNSSGAVSTLTPNTTYYGRVFAENNNEVNTAFLSLGSTMTLTSSPQGSAIIFNPVLVSSLTVNYTSGFPANPANTLYDIQLSTDPAFSIFLDSQTLNLSAGFINLSPNTTYYAQGAAFNSLGTESAFNSLSDSATLAVSPVGPGTFSQVGSSEFSVSWGSGTLTTGYNPANTNYLIEASTDPAFGIINSQVLASTTSAGIGGLLSGTLYYVQVQAVNWSGIATPFISLGSVTTLNSAAPTFINGTFELSDVLGAYVPYTQYTNTTTPNMQIQVQSNYTPGLSVTDTPSQLALWHLDEGAGTASEDSSLHGNNLSLNGGYTWVSGEIGSAIQFNGSSGYGVSPSVSGTGWRTSAANNQWSIALWFNTGLAHGFLFQVANSAAAGAATYDGELSWYKTTGKLSFEITSSAGTRYYASASASYNNNLWHFATGVLSASGFYLYVDGNLVASNTSVNSTNAQTYAGLTYLWLGAASTLGANMGGTTGVKFYPGTIDEVLVTTTALTATQISQLYSLTSQETHEMGAPNVDLSTQAGSNYSWTRISTAAFALTGTDGTTAAQTWTSTPSLSNFSFIQSTAPDASTNQVMFLEDSLDSQLTTAQYTILIDTTPPTIPTFTSLSLPTTIGLTINGLSATDALSGLNATPFYVQASTDSNFGIINTDSGWITGPNFTFSTLLPNTTYFIRAQARDAAGSQGNQSAFSASQNLATLALLPSATNFIQVYFSSATLGWAALQAAPSSASAEGYELDASTAPDFSGIVFSSVTTNVLDSTLTIGGLSFNATDYFRLGTFNLAGVINYTSDIPLDISLSTSVAILNLTLTNIISTVSVSPIVITNSGNIPETVLIYGSTATPSSPWTLGTSTGIETALLQGLWNSTQPLSSAFVTSITTMTTTSGGPGGDYSGNENALEIPAGQSRAIWFQFWRPTSSVVNGTQTIDVYFTPVYP